MNEPPSTPRPAFQALGSRFLKRTVAATVISLALVAMTAAAYGYPRWGGYYLFMGLTTLMFLGTTTWILKAMMFDRRPGIGMLWIGLKLILLTGMIVVLDHWSRTEKNSLLLGTALVAGAATPFLVLVLRALGGGLAPR